MTRVLTDSATGELLAAVLVPNAINPTSAFLQILPLARVTETSLNMEQAMSMIMTGGAVGPDTIRFSQPGESGGECYAACAHWRDFGKDLLLAATHGSWSTRNMQICLLPCLCCAWMGCAVPHEPAQTIKPHSTLLWGSNTFASAPVSLPA